MDSRNSTALVLSVQNVQYYSCYILQFLYIVTAACVFGKKGRLAEAIQSVKTFPLFQCSTSVCPFFLKGMGEEN